MSSASFPDKPSALAFIAKLDALLGIPDPNRFPGTVTWAEPREMKDGTFTVPLPRKGPLALFQDAIEAAPVELTKALTEDTLDKDGKIIQAKKVAKKDLTDIQDKISTAKEIDPSQLKLAVVAAEAVAEESPILEGKVP